MYFTVKKDDLAAAAIIVARATSSKIGESSSSVRLIAEDGSLTLTANDLELAITAQIKAEVLVPGSIMVPGRLLSEASRRFPSDEVTMQGIEGRQTLRICSGVSDMELVGMAASHFPEIPEIDDVKVIALPESLLKNMIKQVSFALSQDSIRPILTGMWWEYQGSRLRLVAADGTKVASRTEKLLYQEETSFSMVMPGRAVHELLRLLDDGDEPVRIAVGKNHCLIQVAGTTLVTKLLEGKYINVDNYVPTEFSTEVQLNPKMLLTALDRCSIMTKDVLTGIVKISFKDQKMCIRAHSAELGSHYEEWPIEKERDDLEIYFNNKVLSDIMRAIDHGDARMKFTGQYGPAICEKVTKEDQVQPNDYWSLVMPVRLT